MSWLFPLTKCNGIPINYHPGAFGFHRKNSYHTGIDLYTYQNSLVYAVEDGEVTGVENFTGPKDNSPWWLDTKCVLVYGKTGTVCYGEIFPLVDSGFARKGDVIGFVIPVLPKKKFRRDIPGHSRFMLHLELYSGRQDRASESWLSAKTEGFLLDPTPHILSSLNRPENFLCLNKLYS
jgi:hypothetical protein